MAYAVAIAAVLVLGGVLLYVLRTANSDRDAFLRAVSLSITAGKEERELLLARVSEMASRVQHPELPYHGVHAVPDPETEPEPDEAFEQVGKILPVNGDGPDDEAG